MTDQEIITAAPTAAANPVPTPAATREERDSLGTFTVPAGALYGVQTARAVDNFPISGFRAFPALVEAVVSVKKAAALANAELGRLPSAKAQAIVAACDEVLAGRYRDQFVVDVFQAGAGTSFNMNANEVLANRANEILGLPRGDKAGVNANDDVNRAQSTNDVFPTAMRLAGYQLGWNVVREAGRLADAFAEKGTAFDGILKSGRTHLQDATPIRLGQEFTAYGRAVRLVTGRLSDAIEDLAVLGIGGTATGTGLNAGAEYRRLVVEKIEDVTGFPVTPCDDPVELMQSQADIAAASSALRALALELIRIANDLRLLSSGPRTGLAEIRLPPVQPGSSIMPGKVNPVMAEMLTMVCFQVIGCDAVIAQATQAGQLELNVMMPVMAWNLLLAETILANAVGVFTDKCVAGIEADADRCAYFLDRSVGLATILNPQIGYAAAAEIAKESTRTGRSIRELVRERGLLTDAEMDALISDTRQT